MENKFNIIIYNILVLYTKQLVFRQKGTKTYMTKITKYVLQNISAEFWHYIPMINLSILPGIYLN